MEILASVVLARYSSITITFLDNIYRPVLYLNHDVLETGSCLRLHVEPAHVGVENPVSKASSFKIKDRMMDNV
jgi:hypothetical protein